MIRKSENDHFNDSGLQHTRTEDFINLKKKSSEMIDKFFQGLKKMATTIFHTKFLYILNEQEPEMPINFRECSFAIPVDILEQKLLLHKGLVMVSQGELNQAKQIFIICINLGKSYDPRIHKECATQLRKILQQENDVDYNLEKLIESFRYRDRDFILLVNQSLGMRNFKEHTTEILCQIMKESKQDSIANQDRVSLIKFNNRLRRIFSLVQKDSNFAQLKNQVDKLEFDIDSQEDSNGKGCLQKAL